MKDQDKMSRGDVQGMAADIIGNKRERTPQNDEVEADEQDAGDAASFDCPHCGQSINYSKP